MFPEKNTHKFPFLLQLQVFPITYSFPCFVVVCDYYSNCKWVYELLIKLFSQAGIILLKKLSGFKIIITNQ